MSKKKDEAPQKESDKDATFLKQFLKENKDMHFNYEETQDSQSLLGQFYLMRILGEA